MADLLTFHYKSQVLVILSFRIFRLDGTAIMLHNKAPGISFLRSAEDRCEYLRQHLKCKVLLLAVENLCLCV